MTKRAIKIRNQTGREGTERAREQARKLSDAVPDIPAHGSSNSRKLAGYVMPCSTRTAHLPAGADTATRPAIRPRSEAKGHSPTREWPLQTPVDPGPVVSANERLTRPANPAPRGRGKPEHRTSAVLLGVTVTDGDYLSSSTYLDAVTTAGSAVAGLTPVRNYLVFQAGSAGAPTRCSRSSRY
jgi:hypothetical protein